MPSPPLPSRFRDRSDLRGHPAIVAVEDRDSGWVVAEARSVPSAKDPHYGLDLPVATTVFETLSTGAIELRVRLHHTVDDQDLARSCARGITALMRTHRARLGRPTAFPRAVGTADLWVIPHAAADPSVGGETRTSHVYLWDCRYRRSPQEWARTIAHEWGHLTLPAARGYAAPEGDAAGHLGEALYLDWLSTEPAGDDSGQFLVPTVAKNWCDRHNAPRLERYQRLGPGDRDFDRRDRAGMDAYVGAALGVGATFGSTVLGSVLRGIENDSPRELLESLRRHCGQQEQILVKLPAWVPLPAGRFRLQSASGDPRLLLDGQSRIAAANASPIRFQKPGWHRIDAVAGQSAAASLIRVHS